MLLTQEPTFFIFMVVTQEPTIGKCQLLLMSYYILETFIIKKASSIKAKV